MPKTTAFGALLNHITGGGNADTFQPMNVNFGLFPEIDVRNEKGKRIKGRERKRAVSERAREDLSEWLVEANNKVAA